MPSPPAHRRRFSTATMKTKTSGDNLEVQTKKFYQKILSISIHNTSHPPYPLKRTLLSLTPALSPPLSLTRTCLSPHVLSLRPLSLPLYTLCLAMVRWRPRPKV